MKKLQHEDFETNSLDEMTIIREDDEKGCLKNLQNYFLDFCKNTQIYGFHYLSDPKRVRIEKLYWLIFIVIAFYLSMTTMLHVWTKFNQAPVMVFAQNHKSIWEVPFPAVTICPEIKIRQTVYNFTDHYHEIMDAKRSGYNLTSEELQEFSDMSLFCDNHLYIDGKQITDFETVYKNLTNVSPSFQDVLFACKWSSLNESCDTLFTPVLTEDGLCFTFNMLDKKELFNDITFLEDSTDNERLSEGWTLDGGYSKNLGKRPYPRRTATAGTKGGLFFLLKAFDPDLDYVCRGPVQGFKVALHQPSETPKMGTEYFRAPINQEVVIAVKPNLVTSSQELKNYDPHQRGCFFSDERKLKFFRNYEQQNCRIECLANFTLDRCGCVAFHMPHENGTKICGSGSNRCSFEAEQELVTLEAEQDTSNQENPLCDCLPACTSLKYHTEISQAHFNWPKVLQGFKVNIDEFPGIHMTRLTIFFKDMHFSSSEKNKLHDRIEILGQCGGLLAFFCGFSFLSLAEVIYFLSLRIICNVRKFGGRFWAGPVHRSNGYED